MRSLVRTEVKSEEVSALDECTRLKLQSRLLFEVTLMATLVFAILRYTSHTAVPPSTSGARESATMFRKCLLSPLFLLSPLPVSPRSRPQHGHMDMELSYVHCGCTL